MPQRELPSGRVTFVFTDIEGSTRLLRSLREGYDSALEQHRHLLREAWSSHDGHEISTSGDSFFVAFADAADALRACAEGQRLLQTASWPPGGDVRVRMGVHSGIATPRGDDYVALAVHQAARVMSAAHGMQVLVSAAAAEAAGSAAAAQLKPLGRYRLRDFEDPVLLYELVSPDLAVVSRTVRALPADGHNLTRPLDTFVGRTAQVAEIARATSAGQLLTLVGPGGVGKTRLAVETGLGLTTAWRDGVWLVDLAPIRQPSLVVGAVLDALGISSPPGEDQIEALIRGLEGSSQLIILDNCEHLLEGSADLVERILARCPDVGIIATSRSPLGVGGEQVYRVEPLALPEAGAPAAEALATPAVQLLLNRTTAHGRSLDVSTSALEEIVELCRRLDGLPLALELAAARLNVVSPGELLHALADGGDELAVVGRRRSERHGSLRRLLDWSYDELSEREQAVLRRLSVFRGSFSLTAFVEAVRGGIVSGDEAPELLWTLADRSLVLVDLRSNETRYRLLETVRDYAASHLEGDERTVAVSSLADWMLEAVGPGLQRDRAWFGRIAAEADNIREIVPALGGIDEERAQLLASAIGRYHDLAHTFRTGIGELTEWAQVLSTPTPTRAVMLATLADLHLRLGETQEAARALREAEEVVSSSGPLPAWDDASLDRSRGELAMRTGDLEGARAIAQEALEAPLSKHGQARMWNLVGIAAIAAGDLDGADEGFRQEVTLSEEVDDIVPLAAGHGNLAEVALRRGDHRGAAREQLLCLQSAQEVGLPVMIAYSLIAAARLRAGADPFTAVMLHTKAEELLSETGVSLYEDDQRESEAMLAAAHAQLGDASYEHAVESGVEADLPAAIDLAVEVLQSLSELR